MTASRITPKLYQGSLPPYGSELVSRGFRTIVLCAAELQPSDAQFGEGLEILRCPFTDNAEPLPLTMQVRVHSTASAVAERVRRGERTLVTCAAGLNRSGLVTAIALTELYGCSGREAVRWVQKEREGALFNPVFIAIIARIPARSAPSPRL